MITSQEIREMTFEKAMFGGYDMGGVDDFLDTVANDIALLQKENATLKGKLKVLANKIEEYRANEDAMKSALIRLEKLSGTIESEAKVRADKIVSDAMISASRITKEAQLELQAENNRLAAAKRASAKFVENMNQICRQQSDYLAQLSRTDIIRDAKEEASRPDIAGAVRAIDEAIAAASVEADIAPVVDVVEEASADDSIFDFGFGSAE